MRVLTIINQEDAGPGVFAAAAADAGHEFVEWIPATSPPPKLDGYGAVIVLGGAMHADQEDEHPWLRTEKQLLHDLAEDGMPLLGVCLGAQLLADASGGSAEPASRPEIGWHEVELTQEAGTDPVIGGLPDRFEAFQWHSFEATPPPGSTPLAQSPVCLEAYRLDELAWGIQFHAEVSLTIAADWIAKYDNDVDAVRLGIDPAALLAETKSKIAAWNELGRGVCARFLEVAERATRE